MPTSNDELSCVFCELSAVLTGEAAVSPVIAERHLKTLRASDYAEHIDAMLRRFAELILGGGDPVRLIEDHLINDATFGPSVKAVLLLWYTGSIGTGPSASPGSQEDYFDALMWSVIGAHPPGLSDGYYGHWRYPPDVGA